MLGLATAPKPWIASVYVTARVRLPAGWPQRPPQLPATSDVRVALLPPLGWQPSRFLTDRAEAERAYALAERLGSVNAAAKELDTTWPSLRTIAAARQRTGQPASPGLDPVFVALNPGALPARARPPAELYQWVRRDEEYATLGANVVVELNSESCARQPTTRAWAIIRRAERAHRHTSDRRGRGERRQADRSARSDRISRSHQPEERGMVVDARLSRLT